jgi:hypothetical protein
MKVLPHVVRDRQLGRAGRLRCSGFSTARVGISRWPSIGAAKSGVGRIPVRTGSARTASSVEVPRRREQDHEFDHQCRQPADQADVGEDRRDEQATQGSAEPSDHHLTCTQASRVGFEPTTKGLKVPCSTAELPAHERPYHAQNGPSLELRPHGIVDCGGDASGPRPECPGPSGLDDLRRPGASRAVACRSNPAPCLRRSPRSRASPPNRCSPER